MANLPGPGCRHGPHMLEDVKAGPFDMARDELGGLVRVAGLDVCDEFAMIADDLRPSRQGEIEPAAHRAEHLAMLPPQLGSVPVVMSLIDQGVELGVEVAVLDLVGEIVRFDLALDPLQFSDIGFRRHPTNQRVRAGSIRTPIS